ncbi:hypothetical protein AALP_AAs46022U000100, partial [Arabis alpina]
MPNEVAVEEATCVFEINSIMTWYKVTIDFRDIGCFFNGYFIKHLLHHQLDVLSWITFWDLRTSDGSM